MRIGIDLDGVLANVVAGVYEMTRRHYGVDVSAHEMVAWSAWPAPIKNTREALRFMDEAYRMCLVPPMELDLAESVRKLRKKHRVCIITKRTNGSHCAVAKWLETEGIVYDSLVFADHRESKFIYPIDVLIEDAPYTVEEVKSHPLATLLLIDRPYNRADRGLAANAFVVSSVKEAAALILEGVIFDD